jgi:hypothetical protein
MGACAVAVLVSLTLVVVAGAVALLRQVYLGW